MKIKRDAEPEVLDHSVLIANLLDKYELIHFAEIDNINFIYRPLGRAEYKSILCNPNNSQWEKEDEICKKVLLWPQNFDFDNCIAGIPTELSKQILDNSFLSNPRDTITLLEMFRNECDEIDSQMCCIISECFPSYKMEEIESWDMMKFCKIYTKAEWIMKNIRQMELNNDIVEFLKKENPEEEYYEEEYYQEDIQEEDNKQSYTERQTQEPLQEKYMIGKKEVSKEEWMQYERLKRDYPEFINWEEDATKTGNYKTQICNTMQPALQPGSW